MQKEMQKGQQEGQKKAKVKKEKVVRKVESNRVLKVKTTNWW